MKLTIHLFATLKERVGAPVVTIDLDGSGTVSDLFVKLLHQYPNLQPIEKNILVSVNQNYADRSQSIYENDEIALFPPVSGG